MRSSAVTSIVPDFAVSKVPADRSPVPFAKQLFLAPFHLSSDRSGLSGIDKLHFPAVLLPHLPAICAPCHTRPRGSSPTRACRRSPRPSAFLGARSAPAIARDSHRHRVPATNKPDCLPPSRHSVEIPAP